MTFPASEKSSKTTTFTEETGADDLPITEEKQKPCKKYKQNWRINLLSMPKHPRGKYTSPPDIFESGVAPGALKVELPERVEHMSRPAVRTLVVNKKQFMPFHKDYEERMDNRIELSWNSIYNAYKKARRDLARKRSASSTHSKSSRGKEQPSAKETRGGKKGKGGKGEGHGKGERGEKGKKAAKGDKGGKEGGEKGEKGDSSVKGEKGEKGDRSGKGGKGEKGDRGEKGEKAEKGKKGKKAKGGSDEQGDKADDPREWVELRARPKKVFLPEPIPRGPTVDLLDLKEKIDALATPKKVELIEYRDPTIIPESALTYVATERILELSRPTAFRLMKEEPIIPGAVKPEALTFHVTERLKTLATPKVAQGGHDTDVREDAFAISPNALKYIATERIKELAKPIER
ncbi:Testicular haploid expressed repeat [Popillia japonica]|uniref:Testicular haploid expressed repeat n=1 Tax=Popillia japonica TaxID=7064 RepID=A0AAW1N0E1_POPJA